MSGPTPIAEALAALGQRILKPIYADHLPLAEASCRACRAPVWAAPGQEAGLEAVADSRYWELAPHICTFGHPIPPTLDGRGWECGDAGEGGVF